MVNNKTTEEIIEGLKEEINLIEDSIKLLEVKKKEAIKVKESRLKKKGRELEIEACKVFVCPNLNQIDIKGKELSLSEETIKLAKDLAVEYLRRTYHRPKYGSIKFLIPAFLYIASISSLIPNSDETQYRTQKDIALACNCSEIPVRKWYKEIIKELKIEEKLEIALKKRLSRVSMWSREVENS